MQLRRNTRSLARNRDRSRSPHEVRVAPENTFEPVGSSHSADRSDHLRLPGIANTKTAGKGKIAPGYRAISIFPSRRNCVSPDEPSTPSLSVTA